MRCLGLDDERWKARKSRSGIISHAVAYPEGKRGCVEGEIWHFHATCMFVSVV